MLGGGNIAALVVVRLKHDDGVGVVAATSRLVCVAVGLIVRVGSCGDLFEQLDDLVGFGSAFGLDAVGVEMSRISPDQQRCRRRTCLESREESGYLRDPHHELSGWSRHVCDDCFCLSGVQMRDDDGVKRRGRESVCSST